MNTDKLQKDQVLQFHVNSNSKLEWVIFKDIKNPEKDTPVVGCIHYVNQTDKDVILTIGIEYKGEAEAKTLKELPPGSATTGGSVHINSVSFSKPTK